ncbi:MAG: ATP-binding protein [Anaerolineae bacterium]
MPAKILVIDDESGARKTLENLLFSEDYDVRFAVDGLDGLTQAQVWLPDVIVLDVMMPGLDGFEVCRRIRADARLEQVPIILLTALDDRQAKLKGLEAGADEFLTKPIDSLELRARLRTLTRLDRFRRLNDERLKLEDAHQDLLQAHDALRVSEENYRRLAAELEERVAQRTYELAAANASLAAVVDRLRDLDRLKSKFVSDVSHELRTPVTSLSVYIDLLEHGKPEKREQYVGKLKEQMARLHKMINDILDMSRLEHDIDGTGRSPVDVNPMAEHVSAMERGAAEAAGLTLTCEVTENLPLVVARPDQLTRAIANLVANAIKYTPRGAVRVQTYQRADQVCVEVADTGPGIAPEDLPHLFERFYRGKAATQSNIPGTGLGLAIVKEIVEAHRGSVEVDSQAGIGSTFRIWLPVAA